MLGVSRGTLRSALQRLEEAGEIVRRQGSGTFVGRAAVPTPRRAPRPARALLVARARRGLRLGCVDLKIEQRPVGGEPARRFGLDPARTRPRSRALLGDGRASAVMFDVVHPSVELPPEWRCAHSLERGQMVLDVLIERGVP